MPFRNLARRTDFNPEQLKRMFDAFDLVWRECSPHYENGHAVTAKELLAHLILDLARDGDDSDAEGLANRALAVRNRAGRA